MQASKIDFDKTFAMEWPIGKPKRLVRVRVEKLVTTKVRQRQPVSHIFGFVAEPELVEKNGEPVPFGPVSPELLLGEWNKYAELVERRQREKEEEAVERKRREGLRADAVAILRSVLGLEKADAGLIADNYSGIRIEDAALPAVLSRLGGGPRS